MEYCLVEMGMLKALLLCERPQDARTMRTALEEQRLTVDHCFDAYTAERLLEAQSYAVIFFDLETRGAMELMRRTPVDGAVRIGLANRSVPVGTLRLGVKAVLFRPVNAERVAVELGRLLRGKGEPRRAPRFHEGDEA